MAIVNGDSTAPVLDPISATLTAPFNVNVKNTGERPQDFPGGFVITEYVNGISQDKTAVKLIGNMAPMQPFPWERTQRLVKEYYPGNPEAAVQVLGPKPGSLTIRGRFKDKRYKDPGLYGAAYAYSQLLEQLTDRGNLVKFGMHGATGDWFRYGYLERASFKMNKLSWVDYELEFFVLSDKQPVNNYFAAQEKQAPSSVNNNLINAAAAFQSTYSAVPKSMPQSIADKLNSLISGVAKNINLVTNFVNTVVGTAESIEASANRALGLIKNARADISSFSRRIDNVAHAFDSLSTQGNPAGQVRDTYTNLAYLYETHTASFSLSKYLSQMQAMFEAIATTLPKARYRVKGGDTLQNISIRFYGVSDNWTKIYDHNKLQTTQLGAGTILEIPNL